MSIREVGRSRERKKPEREVKEEEEGSGRKVGAGLKHHLGAIDIGVKLSVRIYGAKRGAKIYGAEVSAELSAKSPPRLCRAQNLDASNDGVETCKLGASNDGVELRVQILKSYL